MKIIFFSAFTLLYQIILAQDSIAWKKEFELDVKSNVVWTIDDYNNIYLSDKDQIKKIAPSGIKMFEQSVKKFGQITSIDARNSLKILLFSEQQQSIFYLDNTLTKQNNDIDLSDPETVGFNLSYVTKVSASNQMDKIWTYDQDNSKISLITNTKSQSIQIENTSGIIEMKNITQFFEQNDRLFVVDNKKGIFMFDIYGTLIQFFPEENLEWIEVNENYIYLLKADKFEILNLQSLRKKEITLPISDIIEFKINQNSFFCLTSKGISKYQIEIF